MAMPSGLSQAAPAGGGGASAPALGLALASAVLAKSATQPMARASPSCPIGPVPILPQTMADRSGRPPGPNPAANLARPESNDIKGPRPVARSTPSAGRPA